MRALAHEWDYHGGEPSGGRGLQDPRGVAFAHRRMTKPVAPVHSPCRGAVMRITSHLAKQEFFAADGPSGYGSKV